MKPSGNENTSDAVWVDRIHAFSFSHTFIMFCLNVRLGAYSFFFNIWVYHGLSLLM
jgi:hypothetical protein